MDTLTQLKADVIAVLQLTLTPAIGAYCQRPSDGLLARPSSCAPYGT